MELRRAALSFTNNALAPFPSLPNPSLSGRDGKKWRVVCSNSTKPSKGSQMVVSITGATGFIGQRLVQKLLADGCDVLPICLSKDCRASGTVRAAVPSAHHGTPARPVRMMALASVLVALGGTLARIGADFFVYFFMEK